MSNRWNVFLKPAKRVKQNEILEIQVYLEHQLMSLRNAIKKYPVKKLIGSSGSFDTFAEMIGYRYHKKNIIEDSNSYKFNLDEFFKLNEIILHSTATGRLRMKGLIRMRVDMIVIASICADFILKKFNLKEMYLSKFALKEGAMWEALNRIRPPALKLRRVN